MTVNFGAGCCNTGSAMNVKFKAAQQNAAPAPQFGKTMHADHLHSSATQNAQAPVYGKNMNAAPKFGNGTKLNAIG